MSGNGNTAEKDKRRERERERGRAILRDYEGGGQKGGPRADTASVSTSPWLIFHRRGCAVTKIGLAAG